MVIPRSWSHAPAVCGQTGAASGCCAAPTYAGKLGGNGAARVKPDIWRCQGHVVYMMHSGQASCAPKTAACCRSGSCWCVRRESGPRARTALKKGRGGVFGGRANTLPGTPSDHGCSSVAGGVPATTMATFLLPIGGRRLADFATAPA